MDDPWGSPWADEAPGTEKTPDVANPKPTIIAPAKPLPFDSDTTSPWDEDKDSRNWSAPLNDIVQEHRTAVVDDSDADWSYHGGIEQEAQPKNAAIANNAASAWTTRSHETEEIRGQKLNGGAEEQSLEDPWGQPDVQPDIKEASNLTDEALGPVKEVTTHRFEPFDEFTEDLDNTYPLAEQQLDFTLEDSSQPKSAPLESRGSNAPIVESPHLGKTNEGPQDNAFESSELSDKNALQSSRPSLSLSERSGHHEVESDSTHTSPGGESIRAAFDRQNSNKVKDLVQLFDGLAVESPGAREDRINEDVSSDSDVPMAKSSSTGGTDDDFGDFEDGVSFIYASTDSKGPSATTGVPVSVPHSKSEEEPIISRPEALSDVERKSIKFDIDTSIVDQLYLDKESLPESTSYGLSDTEDLISDSFSTVEQRKVWYRISRYGTMRKHSSGDDDNFVRIDWQHSKVREETLKIVRKWMEEDRLGAGMTLGEVGRVEAMFSWGKPGQAPVADALPNARKVLHPTRAGEGKLHSSVSRHSVHDIKSGHKRQPSSVSSIKSIVSSPAEASRPFSWSTAQPRSSDPVTAITSASSDSHPESFHKDTVVPPVLRASKAPTSFSVQPLKPQPAISTVSELGKEDNIDAGDNDDEWGEMVASPTTSSFPNISSVPFSSPGDESLKTAGSLNQIDARNTHAVKHLRNSSLGFQASEFTSGEPFDKSPIIPKTPNRATIGDFSALAHSSEDPWANADFSFFDSPSITPAVVEAPKSSSTSQPVPPTSKPLSAAAKGLPAFNNTKQDKVTHPQRLPSPNVRQKSKKEMEEDKIVRDIINGLPDFSFMLR